MPQPDTDPPDTEQSAQFESPLAAAQRRVRELEEQIGRRPIVVREAGPEEPWSRRAGRAITQTRAGQVGALAAAVAVVMTAASPIVVAWMDVSKLRAELTESRADVAKAQARIEALERWQLDVGQWRNVVGAAENQRTERDAWRDRVLCRTGNQPPWKLELTCPVRTRVAELRLGE